jgi:hypothetical protein
VHSSSARMERVGAARPTEMKRAEMMVEERILKLGLGMRFVKLVSR